MASPALKSANEAEAVPAAAAPAEDRLGGMRGGAGSAAPRRRSKMKKEAKSSALLAVLGTNDEADADGAFGEGEVEEATTRSWFPETFLFEPRIVTGADGRAEHATTVPDRLTTWRVLALAHSRDGAQAGITTSFLGTLPIYIDPILPTFLVAGDRVRLPVQVVNTTSEAISTTVELEAKGAKLTSARRQSVRVPARGSVVLSAKIAVDRSGELELRASVGADDAVARRVPIRPSGRPHSIDHSGTLAAPRTFELVGPADLDPSSAQVGLTVYAGALSMLRSELAAAPQRGGVAEDAYTLLLAGQAPALLQSLGDEPDAEALRKIALIASQRAIRHARSPNLPQAVLLAEAALAHPNNPLLSRLGARLVSTVQGAQRPDGTYGGGSGWTLQRLLVTTARATRAAGANAGTSDAAKRSATLSQLRANFAFERYVNRVEDPYTAATIVSSGALSGSLEAAYRKRVRDAIETRGDGSRYLPVPAGVVRGDGGAPSELEATALAALALKGDDEAPWRADLGATLLAGYSGWRGWGDGVTNLECLRAVVDLFSEPVPPGVDVVLEMDGALLARGTLDATKVRETLTLFAPAPGAEGKHQWSVRADPPVPGLGFALSLNTWVPWRAEPSRGLDLAVRLPDRIAVTKPASIEVQAVAPAAMALTLKIPLPAGVQTDASSLDRLVSDGKIDRYESIDGLVTLHVPSREPGVPFVASFVTIATLAGKLHPDAPSIAAYGGTTRYIPPVPWTVER